MGSSILELEEYLYSLKRKGPKLGLERISQVLHAMGDPQDSFKSVLVGGTNGKGSTVAIIDSIMRRAGYRTGRYISPHLSTLNERICVDGEPITDDEFIAAVMEVRDVVGREQLEDPSLETPTFFETTTAAAFKHFHDKSVDFAVVEVGLGGRLDATNTLRPLASVITNISLEHTEILGDTVEKIAFEKAGIIKEGGILITGSRDSEAIAVFEKICKEHSCRILRVGKDIEVRGKEGEGIVRTQSMDIDIDESGGHALFMKGLVVPLLGEHQLVNSACAIGAIHCMRGCGLRVSDDAIRAGLLAVRWPGRMEIVQENPLVMLDCSKDLEAAKALGKAYRKHIRAKRTILVASISSDKDIPRMVGELAPLADTVIACAHKVMGRACPPEMIAREAERSGIRTIIVPDVTDAVRKAISMAGRDGAVLVAGSVFTVGEAREIWFPHEGKSLGRDFNETPRK